MKRILGLDLGTNSIGWALVNEAENQKENSSIIKLGVRVIHFDNFVKTSTGKESKDPQKDFVSGKGISPNAGRTQKRGMRRNLHRYKLRREKLIETLNSNNIITESTTLAESGNNTTFETYQLRAKAVTEKISLEQFGRVLLMINKKRGYKSNRKTKIKEEGQAIDGMATAKKLYNENLTPGQLLYDFLQSGEKQLPDFYRSDLQNEFDRIWNFQKHYHPDILTENFKKDISGNGNKSTAIAFKKHFDIYTAENKGKEKRLQAAKWRVRALSEKLPEEVLAFVIADINGQIKNSSGYLGDISDRSKELYFKNLTVGQYLMAVLDENPHCSLKNRVFYRQDYMDEFEHIWENQAKYHLQLTPELKREIRDIIIFYQRRLKSQKGLINFCEFESKEIQYIENGKAKTKTIGARVIPKSSPLFQEFKIWQNLNNIKIIDEFGGSRFLNQDEMNILAEELSIKKEIKKRDALRLLFTNAESLDLNFEKIEGNRTQAALYEHYQKIIHLSGHDNIKFDTLNAEKIIEIISGIFTELGWKSDFLKFDPLLEGKELENQPMFQLWHLLYSFEEDGSVTGNASLIKKINDICGFEKEYAQLLTEVIFEDDYGMLSTKAIRKILPHLKDGLAYAGRKERPEEPSACEMAGYRHSKGSLTKEELDHKALDDKLNLLPKNSLRNPVVEKILNQLINVVNQLVETYGKPDEIRIEMARELKKSAKEREQMTAAINKVTAEHEQIRKILHEEFGLSHVSKNDIIRYKLYKELEYRGYKTLYSNTYIPKEKLFSKEFDIEHIIPKARLFDDSFSNKTIEKREINLEKDDMTAYDYVLEKYGELGLKEYLNSVDEFAKNNQSSKTKCGKLKMKAQEVPDDFIARDLRDSQYIARKGRTILEQMVKHVVPTTGSITNRLREDWQLVDMMKELNWAKFDKLDGFTEKLKNRDGHIIYRIKNWNKRNDHRHHAMDALTVAFTKSNFIQYLNNLNARKDQTNSVKKKNILAIEQKELYRDGNNKFRFKPPMPLDKLRAEAKMHLESILVSVKTRNKVVSQNINKIKTKHGYIERIQLTPRSHLHNETIYGKKQRYICKEEKVGGKFDEDYIQNVAKKKYREALQKRLLKFGNDPKKAFTGMNSLAKNPVFLDAEKTLVVPEKVKTVKTDTFYTIRKDVTPELKVDKVVDKEIRKILKDRLSQYNNSPKEAFSNLETNPIWINKRKGIALKRVTITGVNNAEALHDKKDHLGNPILDEKGRRLPVDFVNTGNNHHVAIYRDKKGKLQENVVSFLEAVTRASMELPIVSKDYKVNGGWQFLFTLKQNEYFVFPNEKTGFNPKEIDLMDPENYSLISPNLFRVQKFTTKDYFFRHHLETNVDNKKELMGTTWLRIGLDGLKGVEKVLINHIGQIVSIGEY
ncbi:MAG: type II CRISPR RNA-guided endonuclease Cas9 [bacterium]